MKDNKFVSIKLNKNNLDTYFIRKSIFEALQNGCDSFEGVFLDVGCGKMPYREFILSHSRVDKYVGLDIETALEYDSGVKPDYTWNGINMPFEDDSFNTAMATEVLEHCPEPIIVLKEIKRVLKPGGAFFFTVPFLWNLHEVPHDEFRYTPFALQRLLSESGFKDIQIKASGGWHAAMAQMLGLWLSRSNLSHRKRAVLKGLLFPVYKWLLRIDKIPIDFNSPIMIPSLYGIAYVK